MPSDYRNKRSTAVLTPVRGWRKVLLLVAAGLALALGILGVALPGLPTTPFVLLAAYCLLRSSPRLHQRLLDSRLFGGMLRDWHEYRGIRPQVRYRAVAIIVLVVGASLVLTNLPAAAKLAIAAVAACGLVYVWRLPVVRDFPDADVESPVSDASAA